MENADWEIAMFLLSVQHLALAVDDIQQIYDIVLILDLNESVQFPGNLNVVDTGIIIGCFHNGDHIDSTVKVQRTIASCFYRL